MLGISIYPEKAKIEEIIAYLDLAAKYNFKRVFANLLDVSFYSKAIDSEDIKKDIIQYWRAIMNKVKEHQMEFVLDVNPKIFKQLNIEPSNLEFFHTFGATGIRLDAPFDGLTEAMMTHNQYNLDIEVNMSGATRYMENILSFAPNKKKLIGCHNFYPMEFSGLSLDFFVETSLVFKDNNIRSAAFVSSNDAKYGPWPVFEGLPTLEMHRDLPIETQVKHFKMMDLIDDIIISNMFASEQELQAIAALPSYPVFKIKENRKLSELEHKIVYQSPHFYRGDVSDALIRSSQSRVTYKGQSIKPKTTSELLQFGDITIPNDNYEHYRGELNIIKEDLPNKQARRNVVAEIIDEEKFLLDFISPWSKFKLEKAK